MKVSIKSPTRVDLAGGTLDLWPLYLMIEDSVTINLSIDIYTYCDLLPRDDGRVVLNVKDLNLRAEFDTVDECLRSEDETLKLLKVIIKHFRPSAGFELTTRSESPVGGGLGGSSSLMISIVNAFCAWLKTEISSVEKILLAKDLEAKVLNTPTGMQDYIPAECPGLNIIDLQPFQPSINTMAVDKEYFSERMLLVDTGKAHHSGINNWQVYKQFIDGDEHTKKALLKINAVAQKVKQVCLDGDWQRLPDLFKEEFDARMMLSSAFSSPEIERLEKLVLQHGAEAVKICGAGGGGSVLVWCTPEHKQKVSDACQNDGFQVHNIKPV